jgi:predicted site-specific integrase-resolvase
MSINTQQPDEAEDRWIGKKEVLRRLGISLNTLKKRIAGGEIHPIILSPNCHRYSENEINNFMAKKIREQAAQKAEISNAQVFQDEQMDMLYGCDWGAEISNYQ